MNGYYVRNMETGKLELHFEKDDYMALDNDQKSMIKSNFLFSRRANAWVSRCKFPHLYYAEKAAEKLGLENAGKDGERLTFAEQQERKAERAEARAERMEEHAENAINRAENLQKPINDMHGDIAFFTQPNINSAGGRAFTNRRNRMFAAYEKGMEEFKKSEYFQECAEKARQTAKKPTSKSFCQRRIDEAEKGIKKQKKNLESYKKYADRINNGAEIKKYSGEIITIEEVNGWIEDAEEIMLGYIEAAAYYQQIIDDLGGLEFSKDNIKPGYIVLHERYGKCEVVKTGSKNFTYTSGRITLTGNYSEIVNIIEAKEKTEIDHPFRVNDEFTIQVYDYDERKYISKVYKVTKVTPAKVTVKCGDERARAISPRTYDKETWYLPIADGRYGYAMKKAA